MRRRKSERERKSFCSLSWNAVQSKSSGRRESFCVFSFLFFLLFLSSFSYFFRGEKKSSREKNSKEE